MILNLPSAPEYETVGKQCLSQAFKIIYDIDTGFGYLEGIDTELAWDYHLGDLSTSLILIHQGIESFMKAKICEESPLLLLESRRTDWPTMPNSGDKDFNELFTIGGDALQRTYCAVIKTGPVETSLIQFIEDVRRTRNKIVHGVSRDYLDRTYLVQSILATFTNFLGRDSWWTSITRQQCTGDDCKGDVLFEGDNGEKQCLLCGYSQ